MTKIVNTVERLTEELEKSKQKLKELRNLQDDVESKILVENSWMRFIRDRLAELKQRESTKNVLPNTEDK